METQDVGGALRRDPHLLEVEHAECDDRQRAQHTDGDELEHRLALRPDLAGARLARGGQRNRTRPGRRAPRHDPGTRTEWTPRCDVRVLGNTQPLLDEYRHDALHRRSSTM